MSAIRTPFPRNREIRDQRREIDALLDQANADRLGGKNVVQALDDELTPEKNAERAARRAHA